MRLSMTHAFLDARQSLYRFPLVIICALVAAGTAIELSDSPNSEGTLLRILMTAVLGIPFFLTLALASEKLNKRSGKNIFVILAGLLTLILYGLYLPEPLQKSEIIRFFILLIGLHFMVAVGPFLFRHTVQALWQFNKDLLLRLISSVLFTLVMFAGLSLALAALENLLNVPLSDAIYLKLFIFLGFVFNTWYFISGIPQDPLVPVEGDDFPRPLRVFAQYILATLVMLYLAILLAYLGKVILTGVWPSGWIGWLVSGVAVAGLLSVVLLSPLHGSEGYRWVGIYLRIFQILMLPSLVMLILAVSKRINQYGITELRYILLILSGWLAVILIAGLLTKRINVRLIPLSLGLLAFALSIGPLGAGSMSLRSQTHRLEEELMAAGVLSDGHFVPAPSDSPPTGASNIIHSIHYLVENFGFESIDDWLTPEMNKALDSVDSDGKARYFRNKEKINLIADELNVPRLWEASPGQLFNYSLVGEGRSNAVSLEGYEYCLMLDTSAGSMMNFHWDGIDGEFGLSENGFDLVFKTEDDILLAFPLNDLHGELDASSDASTGGQMTSLEAMTFDYGNEELEVRLIIHSVVFQGNSEDASVMTIKGLLLLNGDVE